MHQTVRSGWSSVLGARFVVRRSALMKARSSNNMNFCRNKTATQLIGTHNNDQNAILISAKPDEARDSGEGQDGQQKIVYTDAHTWAVAAKY